MTASFSPTNISQTKTKGKNFIQGKQINILKIITLVCSLLFLGCSTNNRQKNNNVSDWVSRPPYNFSGENIAFTNILDMYKERYFALLSDKPYCVITENEYQLLTGRIIKSRYAIAIRAVYTNDGGSYKVTQNDKSEILVKHYVLGTGKKINRDVLVLELDELPSNVFVSCASAK